MADSQNQVNDDANPNGFEAAEAEKINNASQQSSSTSVVNGESPSSSSAKPNPLGNLSSYTYGLSLYMVNQTAMNRFISSGGSMTGITGDTDGVRIIAQSGGLSDSDNGNTSMDGTRLEYYIDDMVLDSILPGGPQKATVGISIKFKIIEPVGFSFLQDLTRAGFEMNRNSGIIAPSMVGIQQHFIIGIKFYGYNVDGSVITQTTSNIKGNGSPDVLPEKYFSIKIRNVKFKLDGRIVTYNFEADILSDIVSNGQVNGLVQSGTTLSGLTVGRVLADPNNKSSLVSVLNKSRSATPVEFPTKYKIEFLDERGNPDDTIANQRMMNDSTFENAVATTFKASDTEKVSISRQFNATTIDPKTASIQINYGTSILTVIDNVITKSQYITQALDQITTGDVQDKTKDNTVSQTLSWYTVNPVVKILDKIDKVTNDWAYEITLQIKRFNIPYVRTTTATRISTYPGPSKLYEYWLTGGNSEIISYEHVYDNLYYELMLASQRSVIGPPKGNTSRKIQNATGADSTGSENRLNQYNEQIVAQMYSPGDQAQAKIKIMGDPEFIMSNTGVDGAATLGNNNFQIDPLSGQVFIEVVFKMASDYDKNGLVNVSGRLQFYGDEIMETLNIKGVVYQVMKVESVFSKGKFTQTLDCIQINQNKLTIDKKSGVSSSERENTVKSNPNLTAETLKRSGVPVNMIGRQGGNAGGKPYIDERVTKVAPATIQQPNQVSSLSPKKPVTAWKSIIQNDGLTGPVVNTNIDDLFLVSKPRNKDDNGTRGGQ